MRVPQNPPSVLVAFANKEFPQVVGNFETLQAAQEVADRLRREGATVLLVEEPPARSEAWCAIHIGRLAIQVCRECGRPICPVCVEATGQLLCEDHAEPILVHRKNTRLRQLFMLFLFSVFLYEVASYVQDDKERFDAEGSVSVVIIPYVSADMLDQPLVEDLTARLPELASWFDAEHNRYTRQGKPYLNLTIVDPLMVTVDPPALAGPEASPIEVGWRSWKYQRYFKKLSTSAGVDVDNHTARIHLVYQDARSDLAAHSRGSKQGRIAVTWVSLGEQNVDYALLTVAHELGHVLGAEDTYSPTDWLAQYPQGFVQPFIETRYPQKFAELMAIDIPIAPSLEAEIFSLDQVRVGYHTAAGMGWIDSGFAHWYYASHIHRPEDEL